MISSSQSGYSAAVRTWLLIGVIMVAVQILVGGITRLTGSGLSITKWEIVTGTVPPMNAADWHEEFELYRQTPQYQKINQGMSLQAFKVIYFWEYIHRLWARSMGFVFAIPFILFVVQRRLDRPLLKKLGKMILLAMIVATFGWIMVASGLNDRPWVNAYKLTLHLNLGLLLFGYVFWVYLYAKWTNLQVSISRRNKRVLHAVLLCFVIQLLLGGVMSGMKAGLYYPTWPDMNGEWLPRSITQASQWNIESFINYDTMPLAPAITQVLHRVMAYILCGLVIWWTVRVQRSRESVQFKKGVFYLCGLILAQAVVGILTVINCVGKIPLVLGVLHQFGAICVLVVVVWLLFIAKGR